MLHHVQIRQGAYLPHWTADGGTYHVVFRLVDSLPIAVLEKHRSEVKMLLAAAAEAGGLPEQQANRLRSLFGQQIESALDQGLGACWLKRPDIARLTAAALQHFDGNRYHLRAWCIMPNHVHVILRPIGNCSLPTILKSWKGYIAHKANQVLGRTGEFWQPEYYDHLIRSERELVDTVAYVQNNPIAAGLRNWSWVWPSPA